VAWLCRKVCAASESKEVRAPTGAKRAPLSDYELTENSVKTSKESDDRGTR
jgi:hypothetical protein